MSAWRLVIWIPRKRFRFWIRIHPRQPPEYDISRAIKNVLQFKEDRQTVGIMSSLNVWGGPDPSNPMAMMNRNAPQQPAWIFLQSLQQDFTVERVEPTATEIPTSVDILMVIHPKNVAEATEYALDQFFLRGGKMIALVDPMALRDEGNNQNPQKRNTGMGGASNLTRLFTKWGVLLTAQRWWQITITRLAHDPVSGETYAGLLTGARGTE